MNSFSWANSLSVSARVYRTMLLAYPKKFREHYETQMVQVFRDSLRDAYRSNRTYGVMDLWLHTCTDLLITALIERIAEGSQYMFSPKFIVLGGLASVCGGLVWFFPALAWQSANITVPLALLLTLGGLAALHVRLGNQTGTLGWAGFVLGLLGTGLVVSVLVWDTIFGNSFTLQSPLWVPLLVVLGIGIFGIACILIGLRTLRTGILPYGRRLPLVLGVLYIGWSISMGFVGYMDAILGIDPWNPMTIPALGYMLLTFPIGILWMVLGGTLAGDAGWQTSNHPPASA